MKKFLDALNDKILLFDGAMGTEIQKLELGAEKFPDGHDGFNDGLTLSQPDIISGIHRSYLDAGADCIETNTFGSNSLKLAEYGMEDSTYHINKTAAELARESTIPFTDKYVVGTMGPTGFMPSSTDESLGKIGLDVIEDAFRVQAEGLSDGGVDALLIETGNDILEIKLAIMAARTVSLPLIANVTLPQYGKMLLGTPVEAAYVTLGGMNIDVFGINCSTGPEEMIPSIKWLEGNSNHPLLIIPNAGMPENENGRAIYTMTPDIMGNAMDGIVEKNQKVRIIGGCCGTTPEHIQRMDDIRKQKQK